MIDNKNITVATSAAPHIWGNRMPGRHIIPENNQITAIGFYIIEGDFSSSRRVSL